MLCNHASGMVDLKNYTNNNTRKMIKKKIGEITSQECKFVSNSRNIKNYFKERAYVIKHLNRQSTIVNRKSQSCYISQQKSIFIRMSSSLCFKKS